MDARTVREALRQLVDEAETLAGPARLSARGERRFREIRDDFELLAAVHACLTVGMSDEQAALSAALLVSSG